MKRIATACALAGLLGLPGCAEEQETLIVLGAAGWDEEEGGCSIDPGSDAFLVHGQLDLWCASGGQCAGVTSSYILGLVLKSQLPPRDPASSNSGTDSSEMQLKSVEVSYRIPQLPNNLAHPALRTFSAPLATDSIPAGSRKGVGVEVVSQAQALALYEEIVSQQGMFVDVTLMVSVVFHAERTGNNVGGVGEVESRDYEFPIQLCSGCSLTCEPCENAICPDGDPAALTWTGGLCGSAQESSLYPAECAGM